MSLLTESISSSSDFSVFRRLFEKATCQLCFTLLSGKFAELKWQLHLRSCDYCCLMLTPPMQPHALARQPKRVGDPQVVCVDWVGCCCHGFDSAGRLWRAFKGGKEEVRRWRRECFLSPDTHSNPRKSVK